MGAVSLSAPTGPGDYPGFARDFFDTFDQVVTVLSGNRLHVALTGDVAAHFAAVALDLRFEATATGGELVAPGSRMFEAMLAFLGSRGRQAAICLPAYFTAPMSPDLVHGELHEMSRVASPRRYFVYDFHLTFAADEREERLVTFCLDENGREALDPMAWLEASETWQDAENSMPEPEGLAARAEALALRAAEAYGGPLEGRILERLQKTAGRLVAYYEDLMADVPLRRRKGQPASAASREAEEERAILQRELARKLGEEAARHRLRIQIRRLAVATIEVPGAAVTWHVSGAGTQRLLSSWFDCHLGVGEGLACERCGTRPSGHGVAFGLCAAGHWVCRPCLTYCVTCQRPRCEAELHGCERCGARACQDCLVACSAGHEVCSGHLMACACCGQAFCDACLAGDRRAFAHGGRDPVPRSTSPLCPPPCGSAGSSLE